MIWPLISFALLNALVAQGFWPFWLHQTGEARGVLERVTTGAMLVVCFFGAIGLAFFAGVMVPR